MFEIEEYKIREIDASEEHNAETVNKYMITPESQEESHEFIFAEGDSPKDAGIVNLRAWE